MVQVHVLAREWGFNSLQRQLLIADFGFRIADLEWLDEPISFNSQFRVPFGCRNPKSSHALCGTCVISTVSGFAFSRGRTASEYPVRDERRPCLPGGRRVWVGAESDSEHRSHCGSGRAI